MKRYTSLSELLPNECAVVSDITLKGGMRRRVQDIGLIKGTNVKCIQKSPLGDPTAYLIRGAVFAIREEDAAGVQIHRMEAE